MKKILSTLLITSTLLFSSTSIEDTHQVFTNLTKQINLSTISKKEFIFFGTQKELTKEYSEIQKSIETKGLNGFINGLTSQSSNIAKGFLSQAGKGIGANIGLGVLVGFLNPYVMSLYSDEQYILIYDLTNSTGEKTRIQSLFVASDFDDEKIIKEYLDTKINNKIAEVK